MKKLIILILVILSIFLIYYCFNTNKKTYIAIGDFFANGINPDNEYRYGYPEYLRDIYSKKDKLKYFDKNYAKDNYSIEKMLQDIKNNDFKVENGQTISVKKVLREADIVTITLGINDLLERTNKNNIKELEYIDKTILDKNIKEISDDLNKLIKEIKKYSKKDIVLVGYYFPNKQDYNNLNYISKKLDKLYKKTATKYKVKYLLPNEVLNQNNEHIYPNYKMYKTIGNRLFKMLQKQ